MRWGGARGVPRREETCCMQELPGHCLGLKDRAVASNNCPSSKRAVSLMYVSSMTPGHILVLPAVLL